MVQTASPVQKQLRFIVLIFACLWYGLILPAHQRGAIRLPETAGEQRHACCEQKRSPDGKPAKSDPVSHCAVCQLVSVTAPPPPICFDVVPLGLLTRFVPQSIHFALCTAPLDPHSGRDPPEFHA